MLMGVTRFALRKALLAAALAWGAAACEHRSSSTMSTDTPTTSPWVQASGLEVQLELPKTPASASAGGPFSPVLATLRFRNASPQPLRFYLITSEPFRSFQSLLTVHAEGSSAMITSAPQPRPHGYVVTEKDFHLLAPGEERSFTQSIYIARMGSDRLSAGPLPGFERGGAFRVRWRYENSVTQWEGGVPTLDGPTKTIFEGKPIPHIWTGKVETEATLLVAAP